MPDAASGAGYQHAIVATMSHRIPAVQSVRRYAGGRPRRGLCVCLSDKHVNQPESRIMCERPS
jgi:hypothetical protein